MKLTKATIKSFEKEQKEFGTDVALFNLMWKIGAGILKDAGVQKISTVARNKNE